MSYLNLQNIRKLNIDINTICQAACPGCARQDGIASMSSAFPNGVSMSLNTWKRILDGLPNLQRITYCGNYGDSAGTVRLPEYIEYANEKHSNLKHNVVSNMGLGSEKFWKDIISYDNVNIIASVDGLENTNHLYRRFVRWNIVEKNLKIVSSKSDVVTWKYIVFPWNQCDIEQAKAIAKKLGFKFSLIYNNQVELEDKWIQYNKQDNWNNPAEFASIPIRENVTVTIDDYRKNKFNLDTDEIVCRTQVARSIHVDWAGNVYPCCWFGGAAFNADPNYRNEFYSSFPRGSWNNLNEHSWEEILAHEFFTKDLVNSWQSTPSATCMGCSVRKKKYE